MSNFPLTSILGGELSKQVAATPMGALRVSKSYRLVGQPFFGATLDSTFWTTPTITNSATAGQGSGQVSLATGTNASGGTVYFASNRIARYIGASSNMFRAQIHHTVVGTAGNIRRWGPFSASSITAPTNGFYFELNGTALNACYVSGGGTPNVVPITSLFTMDTNCNTYEIYMTNKTVYYCINDTLIYKLTMSTAPGAATLNLPITLSNANTSIATAITMNVRVASISRLGEELTAPISRNITTATSTTLKLGPGTLHAIIFNSLGSSGSTTTIYDNVTGAAPAIGTINSNNANLNQLNYGTNGLDFYTGLTIDTVGNPTAPNLTVLYE